MYDPDLDRPELDEDVERIASVLTRDFGYIHVRLPGSPTLAQLADGLRSFCMAPGRRQNDFIAVYLACHVEILEPGEFVLLPSDIDPNDVRPRAVPIQTLFDWLLRETYVRRLLLILDTSYSRQGGQEIAQAAARGVLQPGMTDHPEVIVGHHDPSLAASPARRILPGLRAGGNATCLRRVRAKGLAAHGAVVAVINSDPGRPPSQTVAYQMVGITGTPPPFLPNPRYRPGLTDADLLEQERAQYAEQRDTYVRGLVPATRSFTGRHAALD